MMEQDRAPIAQRVGDRVRSRIPGPWEVFGERSERYEIHLTGYREELVRGPIIVEGYGIRTFRPKNQSLGIGLAASIDSTDEGINRAVAEAETIAESATFPVTQATMPQPRSSSRHSVEILDRDLATDMPGALEEFVVRILGRFEGVPDVQPSFGSVRAGLTTVSLTNSEGIETSYSGTHVELEFAAKAFGGPEGPPPAEYWVNSSARKLKEDDLGVDVDRWIRLAKDMRRAEVPPSEQTRVLFPNSVLSGILPPVIGYRMSGQAALRKMSFPDGARLGSELVSIHDDGLLPYGLGTSPVDDEGSAQARSSLLNHGIVDGLLCDTLHATALDRTRVGNAKRGGEFVPHWFKFTVGPNPTPTNLVLDPSDGGSDEEMIEAAGEGIWVEQLGWAFPDPIAGNYGGELRAAYRIRNGRLAEPLRGGTVGGMVLDSPGERSLLSTVSRLGSESRSAGYLHGPTVQVDGVTVAGK